MGGVGVMMSLMRVRVWVRWMRVRLIMLLFFLRIISAYSGVFPVLVMVVRRVVCCPVMIRDWSGEMRIARSGCLRGEPSGMM